MVTYWNASRSWDTCDLICHADYFFPFLLFFIILINFLRDFSFIKLTTFRFLRMITYNDKFDIEQTDKKNRYVIWKKTTIKRGGEKKSWSTLTFTRLSNIFFLPVKNAQNARIWVSIRASNEKSVLLYRIKIFH